MVQYVCTTMEYYEYYYARTTSTTMPVLHAPYTEGSRGARITHHWILLMEGKVLHQVGRFANNRKRWGEELSISDESRGPEIRDMCMFVLVGRGFFHFIFSPSVILVNSWQPPARADEVAHFMSRSASIL